MLCCPSLFALLVGHVPVPCSCPRELGAAVGTRRLGSCARLLALVPEQVAEVRELASVAAVLPALWLRPAVHNSNVVTRFWCLAWSGLVLVDGLHHLDIRLLDRGCGERVRP